MNRDLRLIGKVVKKLKTENDIMLKALNKIVNNTDPNIGGSYLAQKALDKLKNI